MLEVKNIRKSFGNNEILKGVDLSIDKGEVVAIIGPSGSGKTTLLRCITFLEKADRGEIVLGDTTADMAEATKAEIKKLRMDMGFVFQSFNLFANMTALQNITEGLVTARGISKAEAKKIGMEMLEKVGLPDKADSYPGELSGGQQQRIAIARAIAPSPQIIFFDEPTSALDPELTKEVLDVIRQLAKEGTTMAIVTHQMSFAKDVASKVVFMEDGSIVEEGTTEAVFEHPALERTRQFITGMS